jgi:hypothetical protein
MQLDAQSLRHLQNGRETWVAIGTQRAAEQLQPCLSLGIEISFRFLSKEILLFYQLVTIYLTFLLSVRNLSKLGGSKWLRMKFST